MDTQNQRSRLDDDNRISKEAGDSRSDRPQQSGNPNENRRVGSTDDQGQSEGEGRKPGQTGGHPESDQEKPRRKPLVNKGFD